MATRIRSEQKMKTRMESKMRRYQRNPQKDVEICGKSFQLLTETMGTRCKTHVLNNEHCPRKTTSIGRTPPKGMQQ